MNEKIPKLLFTTVSLLAALLILTVQALVFPKSHSSHRESRSISFYNDYLSDLSEQGISARAGEIEFFRLSLQTNPRTGKSAMKIIKAPETIELMDGSDDDEKFISKKYRVKDRTLEYPSVLLEKIQAADKWNYYMDLIQKASLEYEGRDITWWGYNKTHEFSIDQPSLDRLDVNGLNVAEDLAKKFGQPKKSFAKKLKFTPSKPSTAISSWSENFKTVEKSSNVKGVILMSAMKGGIDSIEDVYNNHDDVLYQFEPLKLIADGCASSDNSAKVDYLSDLLSCKFDPIEQKIAALKKSNEKAARFVGKGGVAFRYKSNRLCDKHFCDGNNFRGDEDKCINQCPGIDLNQLTSVCQEKTPVVTIKRVCNLAALEKVVTGKDYKMVVMFKDPRAIAESRIKAFSTWSKDQIVSNMKWTCLDMARSMNIANSDPEWTENKIMMVRAEDLAENEGTWMKNILNFTGLDNVEVKKKESLQKIQSWRFGKSMSYDLIQRVQEVCKDLMSLTNYKLVMTEEELKDKEMKFY